MDKIMIRFSQKKIKIIKNPQKTIGPNPSVPYLSTIQNDIFSFLRIQIMPLSVLNKTSCNKCKKDGSGIKITTSYLEEGEIYFCCDCILQMYEKLRTMTSSTRTDFFRFLDANCEYHFASIHYHKILQPLVESKNVQYVPSVVLLVF